MTKQELNRDIKRLAKKVADITNKELPNYDNIVETEIKKEFKRLYSADKEFTYMNVESVKIMLRLNLRFRFEPLHMFGIFIEIDGITK